MAPAKRCRQVLEQIQSFTWKMSLNQKASMKTLRESRLGWIGGQIVQISSFILFLYPLHHFLSSAAAILLVLLLFVREKSLTEEKRKRATTIQ